MAPKISGVTFVLLVFLVGPSVSIRPEVAPLHIPRTSLGEKVSIICSSIAGAKPITFSWKKNGLPVEEDKINNLQNQIDASALIFKSLLPSDRGNYSCTAKNSFGEDTKSAELNIAGEYLPNS